MLYPRVNTIVRKKEMDDAKEKERERKREVNSESFQGKIERERKREAVSRRESLVRIVSISVIAIAVSRYH